MPRAETPFAEAAPVTKGMGLPVGVGAVPKPLDATVGVATAAGEVAGAEMAGAVAGVELAAHS